VSETFLYSPTCVTSSQASWSEWSPSPYQSVATFEQQVEFDQEEDGRWIADFSILPGVMSYGATKAEALARVRDFARDVVMDRLAHAEEVPKAALSALS